MTTLTTARHTTHHLHLPTSSPRRAAAAVLVVLGGLLLGTTFARNLFNVGPAFEDLMGGFRPHLTQTAITQAHTDVQQLGAAGTEMQTKLIPALAPRLGMTPAQLTAYLGRQYPAVAAGMTALPQATGQFDGLITTLDQQRPLFAAADAIPTKDLPATTVPWSLAGAGVLLIGAGALLWVRPRLGAGVAVVLGAALVAGSFAMSLPSKASDADDLNSNLKPVYTTATVDQARTTLATISAMGTQLQTQMLPGLATQLRMTPAQLQQMLQTQFPATAAAMAAMPASLPRFQALVKDFDANLGNYGTLKPVSFAPIIWLTVTVGALALVAGGTFLLWPRHDVVAIRISR